MSPSPLPRPTLLATGVATLALVPVVAVAAQHHAVPGIPLAAPRSSAPSSTTATPVAGPAPTSAVPTASGPAAIPALPAAGVPAMPVPTAHPVVARVAARQLAAAPGTTQVQAGSTRSGKAAAAPRTTTTAKTVARTPAKVRAKAKGFAKAPTKARRRAAAAPAPAARPRATPLRYGQGGTYGSLGYPYAGTFWTARVDTLPAGVVDPASDRMAARLADQVSHAGARVWWLNSGDYNARVYVGEPGTRRGRIAFGGDCGGRPMPPGWHSWADDVPLDPSWVGSNGTDSSIVIVDVARRRAYSLWLFRGGDRPTACHGGWMSLTADRRANAGQLPGTYPDRGGATASSLPHDAGSISREDIAYARRHGYFPHALYVGLPVARSGRWSCPASRTDGSDGHPDAIMEGQRLRLRMSDREIAALPTQLQQWVARTGVRHGFLPGDQTGDTAILSTVQDPGFWSSFLPSQREGTLADIPFASRLQVLRPDTGCR
ncbi:hypothetical protein QK900_03765 [Arsenicicoccus dermatophilus]|uniref:hypothetical protein n=1 Tax=Arsenicicoccus dermatophilus TaxID=1076331 RepID=UPI003891D48C